MKKNMNLVLLMGGLGNQMFQYAFGQALENGCDTFYDLSWFNRVASMEGVTFREYELNHFNLELKTLDDDTVEEFKKPVKSIYPKLIRKIFKIEKWKSPEIREKIVNVYEKELLLKTGFFVGYFQTEKYFKGIRNKLINDFSLKDELNDANKNMLDKIKEKENSVSLHIRRGDYVTLDNGSALLGLDYYKRAIEYVKENIKNPHFFLFSDDIKWVKENFTLDFPYTVVDINKDVCGCFDMNLMKNCKHNIIANSSFSWWGAWLNENKDKIVIAPMSWGGECAKNKNRLDIHSADWVVL